MKKILIVLFILCYTFSPANRIPKNHDLIKVAVFDGYGASEGCVIDAMEAIKIDPGISPWVISASDIMTDGLDDVDVLVFAGGSGSRQCLNLGHQAMEKIKAFASQEGKGIVGICAGSYMLSDTPNYACFHLAGVEGIDRDHDERGYGIIEFSLNEKGFEIFPELKNKKSFLFYYEGPLFIPVSNSANPATSLGTILSDVHCKEGAPVGLTPGKPLYLTAPFGKGRLFLSVCHPETTPGMRWMLPRMVRWVAQKPLIPYNDAVVRPSLYTKEILFDKELRQTEETLFQTLLYGDSKAKITAIQRLVELHSWDARLWFPGLLRDKDPSVRVAAANAIAEIEYTYVIPDLAAALNLETDPAIQKEMKQCLDRLQNLNKHPLPPDQTQNPSNNK